MADSLSHNCNFCHFNMKVYLKKSVIFFIILNINFACINPKMQTGRQGIVGEVRWVEGNLMPALGDTTITRRYKGIPIQRQLYIFQAVKKEHAISGGEQFYKKVNAELVARIQTDKEGFFKLDLPPGKYSVFVMEDDGFFANTFDGSGFISPVTVHENDFTEIIITVNYKAYY